MGNLWFNLALLLAASGLQAQSVPGGQQAQAATPVSQPASLLQQPAREAKVILSGQSLSIRADNSNLSAILRDIASKSGMQIEGLSSDERVFGNFGPGAPSDVLADLLNGTGYNLLLLGDLGNGAPRELILTPATHGSAAPAAGARMNPDDTEADAAEIAPPQAEIPPEPGPPPPSPGVKSPQQLFEQLQRMRQAQAQGQGQPDPQQQPQP